MRRWTLEEAIAALPEVAAMVRRVRRLVAAALEHAREHGGDGAVPVAGNGHGPTVHIDDRELRAFVAEIEQRGIIVRDPARGLIDFPATSPSGRTYLLCWLDGEESIDWWHWPDDGFAGRTPIDQPPE